MAPQRAEVVFFFFLCVCATSPFRKGPPFVLRVRVYVKFSSSMLFFFFLGGGELFWLFAYSSPCSWR